jgi:hypothetical protein
VVGEPPTTVAALPPRQPDPHAQHLVADHVPQPSPPQFVGGEDLTFFANGTNLTVADPISAIPPHGRVMLLDFVGQICDVRHRFEMFGSEVLSGELAPFFVASKPIQTSRDMRAGFQMQFTEAG